jgi:hypothetical protein
LVPVPFGGESSPPNPPKSAAATAREVIAPIGFPAAATARGVIALIAYPAAATARGVTAPICLPAAATASR